MLLLIMMQVDGRMYECDVWRYFSHSVVMNQTYKMETEAWVCAVYSE